MASSTLATSLERLAAQSLTDKIDGIETAVFAKVGDLGEKVSDLGGKVEKLTAQLSCLGDIQAKMTELSATLTANAQPLGPTPQGRSPAQSQPVFAATPKPKAFLGPKVTPYVGPMAYVGGFSSPTFSPAEPHAQIGQTITLQKDTSLLFCGACQKFFVSPVGKELNFTISCLKAMRHGGSGVCWPCTWALEATGSNSSRGKCPPIPDGL